jgi:hypothetical protein
VTSASSRRGLLVVGLLVLVLAVFLDLSRSDSLLKSAWAGLNPERPSPREQRVDDLRRTFGVPKR